MSHPATPVPTGSILTVAGGLMAQTQGFDPTHAGWYVVILGLLSGGYNYWKAWLDTRTNQARIDSIREDLAEAKKRRQEERELSAAEMMVLRDELEKANAKVKQLTEGQRVNGRAVVTLGEATGVDVSAAIPPDGTGEHSTLP